LGVICWRLSLVLRLWLLLCEDELDSLWDRDRDSETDADWDCERDRESEGEADSEGEGDRELDCDADWLLLCDGLGLED
jgi:hypothetical protein